MRGWAWPQRGEGDPEDVPEDEGDAPRVRLA